MIDRGTIFDRGRGRGEARLNLAEAEANRGMAVLAEAEAEEFLIKNDTRFLKNLNNPLASALESLNATACRLSSSHTRGTQRGV